MLPLRNCQEASVKYGGYQYDLVSDKYGKNNQGFSLTNQINWEFGYISVSTNQHSGKRPWMVHIYWQAIGQPVSFPPFISLINHTFSILNNNVVSRHHFTSSATESVASLYSVCYSYCFQEWIWEDGNSELRSLYPGHPYHFYWLVFDLQVVSWW